MKNKVDHENAVRENLIKNMTVKGGIYEIKLPWKCRDNLYDNRNLSERRLKRTTQKLILQNKYEAYNAVFEEWLKEEIIEVVQTEELFKACCYLQHRGVFKKGNATTKVRPVFDASSK